MITIGIFWFYHGRVIGKARPLSEAEPSLPGIFDSPDTHIELWENTPGFLTAFPQLVGTEYQSVPRGRVLWHAKAGKAVVYMDRQLHTQETKARIAMFFGLEPGAVIWKSDPHYAKALHLLDEFDP